MIDFEKILKAKGKSKADLARFLDIDPSNVNRTIKNDNITLSKIENICSFLDISLIDAMRISGYDDTPGVIPETNQKEKVSEYKDLLLSLSDQLVDLYHKKILAPYSVVEEKEKEIKDLNREIGRLEADNERLREEYKSYNQKITSSQGAPNLHNPPVSIVDNLVKHAEANPQRIQVFKAQPMTEGEDNRPHYNKNDLPFIEIPPEEEKNRG